MTRERQIPENWKIEVKWSRRSTVSVSAREGNIVLVKAPLRTPRKYLLEFVAKNQGWLEKQFKKLEETARRLDAEGVISPKELKILGERALKELPDRVAYFAKIVGVTYGRITIRNQRTRWGSCSTKGNLNFNCLLILAPKEVMDYVVVHELCHRLEMNHSPKFWAHVERVLPDYRVQKEWLKKEGSILIRRMAQGIQEDHSS